MPILTFNGLSKGYLACGWRVGWMAFCNAHLMPELRAAVQRLADARLCGPAPQQYAIAPALDGPQECVEEIRRNYEKRRDVMVKGLHDIGWMVDNPKASMYIWAKIPDAYKDMGSIEFAKKLLRDAKIAVAPGIGFGDYGDDHVRIALIENESRSRQAIRGIKEMFRKDGLAK